jgi:hypothetical protein
MSLTAEIQAKHKAFHAQIAKRASLVSQKEERTFTIPNAPFGTPKLRPVLKPMNESLFWHQMWCFDLVFNLPRPAEITLARITVRDIQDAVCKAFEVSFADLLSPSRARHICLPRQVGYYLSRTLGGRSYPEIARRFGGRDHTSAIAGFNKIERLLATDEKLRERVKAISISLGAIP